LHSIDIPEGSFGTYAEYIARFQDSDTSEENVLRTMRLIQDKVLDISFL
jgi:hypothetical protein